MGSRLAQTSEEISCVADVKAILGEGPIWAAPERALYWVDINGRKIFRRDETGTVHCWATPMKIGSLVPRSRGGFIAGTEGGLALVDLQLDRFDIFANPTEALPDNRLVPLFVTTFMMPPAPRPFSAV